MATSVAAALAAEFGLRTAAELRPAAEAPVNGAPSPAAKPSPEREPRPEPSAARLADEPGGTAVTERPAATDPRSSLEARLVGESNSVRAARLVGELRAASAVAVTRAPRSVASLAEAGAATRPDVVPGTIRPPRAILPVTPDISALLPYGGLATVTAITASRRGATSLLWRLLAGPTRAGAWCALVGMPGRYPLAATAAGADLERLAFVDVAGPLIADAAGALAEGVAAMVVPSDALTPAQARRLTARARKGGTAIVWWETRPVAGPDARLEVARVRWKGLRANAGRLWGAGRLDACELDVAAHWRSGGGHRAQVWPYGGQAEAEVVDLRTRERRR